MALSSEPRLSPPTPPAPVVFSAGHDPYLRAAAFLFLGQAAVWGLLLFRWATFTLFNWTPLAAELALAAYSPLLTYALYGGLLVGTWWWAWGCCATRAGRGRPGWCWPG